MITFGRFGHVEDRGKEKEIFLKELNSLMKKMTFYEDNKEYKETEIIKPLKEILKKKKILILIFSFMRLFLIF